MCKKECYTLKPENDEGDEFGGGGGMHIFQLKMC
jgi:hypothetical protein